MPRMGREVRLPTLFHPLRPSRTRGFINIHFPTQCRQIIAVAWEAAFTWGRNNHTIHPHTTDPWGVRMAVLAILRGIVEMSSSTHTHSRNIQIMILACSRTPPRPAPHTTPKFTILANRFLRNQMYRILSAGQTRNHTRFGRFSVSHIHTFHIPCSSITASDCLRRTTMAHLLNDRLHITVVLKAV